MATTIVTFCSVGIMKFSSTLPIPDGESAVSETITPSASNQQSAAATKEFCVIGTDTAIYVGFGSNPDATSDAAVFMIPANGVMAFQIEVGNKVSVVAV